MMTKNQMLQTAAGSALLVGAIAVTLWSLAGLPAWVSILGVTVVVAWAQLGSEVVKMDAENNTGVERAPMTNAKAWVFTLVGVYCWLGFVTLILATAASNGAGGLATAMAVIFGFFGGMVAMAKVHEYRLTPA